MSHQFVCADCGQVKDTPEDLEFHTKFRCPKILDVPVNERPTVTPGMSLVLAVLPKSLMGAMPPSMIDDAYGETRDLAAAMLVANEREGFTTQQLVDSALVSAYLLGFHDAVEAQINKERGMIQ